MENEIRLCARISHDYDRVIIKQNILYRNDLLWEVTKDENTINMNKTNIIIIATEKQNTILWQVRSKNSQGTITQKYNNIGKELNGRTQ